LKFPSSFFSFLVGVLHLCFSVLFGLDSCYGTRCVFSSYFLSHPVLSLNGPLGSSRLSIYPGEFSLPSLILFLLITCNSPYFLLCVRIRCHLIVLLPPPPSRPERKTDVLFYSFFLVLSNFPRCIFLSSSSFSRQSPPPFSPLYIVLA